jgi:hypothetical protein
MSSAWKFSTMTGSGRTVRRIDATKEGATTLGGGSNKDEGIVVENIKTTGFEPVPVNLRGSN